MTHAKKMPGLAGRAGYGTNGKNVTNGNDILPQNPARDKLNREREQRAARRNALRRLVWRISFAGQAEYRAARTRLGLKNTVSIFELDTAALGDLYNEVKYYENV